MESLPTKRGSSCVVGSMIQCIFVNLSIVAEYIPKEIGIGTDRSIRGVVGLPYTIGNVPFLPLNCVVGNFVSTKAATMASKHAS